MQREGCLSHRSCKHGSLGSCRIPIYIGHSFPPQNLLSIGTVRSVHRRVLAQLLWHGSGSAYNHDRGDNPKCQEHIVHRQRLLSAGDKHSDRCLGRRCDQADCKAGTACSLWRRSPKTQPGKRRTVLHPLRAYTCTSLSRHRSHCFQLPLGHKHMPCNPCPK